MAGQSRCSSRLWPAWTRATGGRSWSTTWSRASRRWVEQAARLGLQVYGLPTRAGGGPSGRLAEARALLRLIQTERPAVFHANLAWPLAGRYALLVAAAAVPAVVATVHSFGVAIAPRNALLHRLVNIAVSRYIAISKFMANRLATSLHVRRRAIEPASRFAFAVSGRGSRRRRTRPSK
ncbi:MAG: glycosyltransferase family 4 protein [Chloroflexi bacterium]|nr:glycosyltransferase family 4 protein [Chloroflexota bacterium]